MEIYTLVIAMISIGVTSVVPEWKTILYGKDYSTAVFVVIGSLAFKVIYSAINARERERSENRVIEISDLSEELLRFGDSSKTLDHGRLTIDVFCYSCETFSHSLDVLMGRFANKEIKATEISLRMLVKKYNRCHVLPWSALSDSSTSYREGNLEKFQTTLIDMENNFTKYSTTALKSNRKLVWAIQQYDFDPVQKGIIINGKHVFWSLYPITPGHRGMSDVWDADGKCDAQGKSVRLIEFRHDGAEGETAASHVIFGWFETVWETFSERWSPPKS